MQRARVYYARGGFHPENCTGCFSGPDRVNSSSCALPAGEGRHAFMYVGVCVRSSAHLSAEYVCACVCVCRGRGSDRTGHTESTAQVITK